MTKTVAPVSLLSFYLQGERHASDTPAPSLSPAHLYANRDLSRVRFDYPVLLPKEGGAVPLRRVVDDLIAKAPEGDEREKVKRTLLRLEVDLKAGADVAPPVEGEVLPCTEEAPERLLRAAALQSWRARGAAFRQEIDELIERLRHLLRGDPHDTLAQTAGLDVAALAEIVGEQRSLPDARRARIEQAIEKLGSLRLLYASDEVSIIEGVAEAVRAHREMMRAMAEAFRAVRIARLEADHHYREDVHDRFFGSFGVGDLSDEETALCPPVLMSVWSSPLSGDDRAGLLELLASSVPVKILLRVTEVCESGETGLRPSWGSRVATLAVAQGGAFVLQTPHASVETLYSGLLEGLRHPGPALFSVYVSPNGAGYLLSAAALESRVFPSFVFHPSAPVWADRLRLVGNPAPEKRWTSGSATVDGKVQELPFTPADFLAAKPQYAAHFWPLPEAPGPSAVPIAEFLEAGAPHGKVPYLILVDEQGASHRVVVTRSILKVAQRFDDMWRTLRELGGIENSHVLRGVEEHRKKLEEESKRQVAEVERKFDRAIGDYTQEIVRRIASGLLGNAPLPAAPAPVVAKIEEKKPEPVKEEEDVVAPLTEPWIDSAICTSCDECIKRNSMMFAYDENKHAILKNANAGPYRDLVMAAEKCPVGIIHPGKPKNPNEPGLDDLVKRAEKFK